MRKNILINSAAERGRRLRKARQENNLTLEKAAKHSGKSISYICDIENGQSCTIDTLDALCATYGVLPEMILFDYLEISPLIRGNYNKRKMAGLAFLAKRIRSIFASVMRSHD